MVLLESCAVPTLDLVSTQCSGGKILWKMKTRKGYSNSMMYNNSLYFNQLDPNLIQLPKSCRPNFHFSWTYYFFFLITISCSSINHQAMQWKLNTRRISEIWKPDTSHHITFIDDFGFPKESSTSSFTAAYSIYVIRRFFSSTFFP